VSLLINCNADSFLLLQCMKQARWYQITESICCFVTWLEM